MHSVAVIDWNGMETRIPIHIKTQLKKLGFLVWDRERKIFCIRWNPMNPKGCAALFEAYLPIEAREVQAFDYSRPRTKPAKCGYRNSIEKIF
jgi:hypothetical protein